MKKLLILNAVTLLALSAQTPSALPPALRGVSESFRTYSGRNLNAPCSTAADGAEEVNPNILYIPKPRVNPSRITTSAVTTPASTMYNQTTGGTLPVTVVGNFAGLGTGFPNWTQQGLLPPDTRSEERRVGKECRYRRDWSSDVCSSDLPDHWWNVAGYGGGQFRRPRHWLPQLDPTGPAAAGYHVGRWKQPDRAVGQPAINGTEQGHWRFSAARPRIRASQPSLGRARWNQHLCDS